MAPVDREISFDFARDGVRGAPSWETGVIAVIIAYYAIRLIFLASTIALSVPPDESTHTGIARLYAEAPFLIENTSRSHELGLVTRVPSLYYLVMGKALWLNQFGVDDDRFLRYMNVVLAMVTTFLAYKLAVILMRGSIPRILFVTMMTNTPMYTFLAASVNYDNLVNLFAVLAVYAFVRFIRSDGSLWLAGMVVWCLVGSLTKISFLPLFLILAALVLLNRWRLLRADWMELVYKLRDRSPVAAISIAAILLTGAGFSLLYGGNIVRYRHLVPTCDQVIPTEACMENRIFARNRIVDEFRTGALTFGEAVQATSRIRHAGDRLHTVQLLEGEVAYQRERPPLQPRYEYLFRVWNDSLKPGIFGIQAHRSMLKDPQALVPYSVILLVSFLLWVRGATATPDGRIWIYLGTIVLSYFLILVGYHNYRIYTSMHAPLLGAAGRYLFPVLVPAYLVCAHFLTSRRRPVVAVAVLLVVSLVFVAGDFPYFLLNVTDAWYATGSAP